MVIFAAIDSAAAVAAFTTAAVAAVTVAAAAGNIPLSLVNGSAGQLRFMVGDVMQPWGDRLPAGGAPYGHKKGAWVTVAVATGFTPGPVLTRSGSD